MFKLNKKYTVLFLIFAFAFVYRMLLMLWEKYPPGADIGLHNSVIYSITQSGNTNFLWNFYQIGGGVSLTFPGYHIFTHYVMIMTGLPDYLVHPLIVSFFSSITVLCAFLLTRAVWKDSATLIVAFLVAVSRFDIEMLLWGGYPNVITLLLIPLAFYLYLQRDRFSLAPFLVATSLLAGSIFLTHSLSAGVFVGIVVVIAFFVFVFPKRLGVQRKQVLNWLGPLFVGAALVSPFLVNAVPTYLVANSSFSEKIFDIRDALLSTRVLPLELVLPLFLCIPAYFLFSKKYTSKFLSLPTVLMAVWLMVPLILTQGYLVGFYIDYNRFLYFVILPVIIFVGVLIDHGSSFFARVIDTYRLLISQVEKTKKTSNKVFAQLSNRLTCRNIHSLFVIGFLLFSFLFIPIFMTPSKGFEVQSFYQVMTDYTYNATQWIQKNTPADSVFVSDALYGWWLSGAQRKTLSAVDPQYLTIEREFEPARFARYLLDTDYVIDNGLVQVREDGGYIGRHNSMFLVNLNWTYFPYAFLHFNNALSTIKYRVGNDSQSYGLDQIAVKEMRMENDTEHATITIKKGNDFLNYTQLTTVYKGNPFVNMSITIESTVKGVSLEYVNFLVNSKGSLLDSPQSNTVVLLDEGVKALAELIFNNQQPDFRIYKDSNPCLFELEYDLHDSLKQEIELSVGVFSVTDDLSHYSSDETKASLFNPIITAGLHPSGIVQKDSDVEAFDYQKSLKARAVSYVVNRDFALHDKFVKDPLFNLVFISHADDSKYIAVFKVNSDT